MPYVKLDTGILDSTLWSNRDERDLFITALLMALPHELTEPTPALNVRTAEPLGWSVPAGWYGHVAAAGIGIVRRSGIEEVFGMEALERLGEPDPESRTADFDGRRVVRISGGFIVLNFMRYRDRDGTAAERAKRYRERKKGRTSGTKTLEVVIPDHTVLRDSHGVTRANVTQAVSSKQEAVSREEKTTTTDPVLEALKACRSSHGVTAYLHYLTAARTPSAVTGELRMVAEGVRGVAPSWEEIGNALHEMLVASAPFTSRVLLGFLRGGRVKPAIVGAEAARAAVDSEIAAGQRSEVF